MMILESIIVLGGLGLVFGIFLAFASKRFSVREDPEVKKVLDILPHLDCGACGYSGCRGYAEAVVKNEKVPADLCVPGQEEVKKKISKITGKGGGKSEKEDRVAVLKCAGGDRETDRRFEYEGIRSCKAASMLQGGPKSCPYGCLGYGDCVDACRFGALSLDKNGLPVVDKEKCVACGECVKACPKGLFELVPGNKKIHVLCSSKDKAGDVTKTCRVGCIACRACEKACPADAIHVKENLAVIDYDKCIQCGKCVSACPRNIITDERKKSQQRKI
ncbi:MAG: RnfABCDGE type electron transport complex subunit B [Nanobdellota archaeon]